MSSQKTKLFAKEFLNKLRRCEEIGEMTTFRRVRNLLKRLGFNELGRGSFGAVFDISHKHVVLKVMGIESNLAYIAYARHCQRAHASNPLLPKVFALTFVGDYAFMIMEKLQEFNTDAQASRAANSIRNLFTPMEKGASSYFQDFDPSVNNLRKAERVLKVKSHKIEAACSKVAKILHREIYQNENYSTFLDVSYANVMRRYNPRSKTYTTVLTDPLAN